MNNHDLNGMAPPPPQPTQEELKAMNANAEGVARGLYQFFGQNKIDKGIAAIAMTMVLDDLRKEGYEVQRMGVLNG